MMCHTYFRVKDEKTGEIFRVPCGQCYACKTRKTQEWVARLMYEERHALSSFFVTLTYAEQTVPVVQLSLLTLQKTDLQKYFKRLRHEFKEETPLKYFACGEYGKTTLRPHYHAIIFNAKSPLQFQSHWPHGDVHVGSFSSDSAAYVVGYANKPKASIDEGDPRAPEFRVMSKGLGAGYCEDIRNQAWHAADDINRFYVPGLSGTKTPLPRLYKQRLYPAYKRKKIGKHFSDLYGDIDDQISQDKRIQLVNDQVRKLKLSTKNRNL